MKAGFIGSDMFRIQWETPSDLQFFIEKLEDFKSKWENNENGMDHLYPAVWVRGRQQPDIIP